MTDSPKHAPTASAEQIECPKCGTPTRAEATACARCGLAVARFSDFAAEVEAQVSQALADKWTAVEANWDDADAHDAFIKAGLAEHAFPYMARCYRAAARDEARASAAEERLADVARRAEAAILAPAQVARYDDKSGDEPFKGVVLMLAVFIAVIVAGTAYAIFTTGSGQP